MRQSSLTTILILAAFALACGASETGEGAEDSAVDEVVDDTGDVEPECVEAGIVNMEYYMGWDGAKACEVARQRG